MPGNSWLASFISPRRPLRKRKSQKLSLERLESRLAPATWTQLTNLMPESGQTLMLLSNGSVLVGAGSDFASKDWFQLTPNSAGSYINGTYTQLASSNLERLFYASNVLPDGRVFVLGGEYSGPTTTQNWTNRGEIYNPVTNSWSPIANFPQSSFGDDPSEVLSDGTVLAGYLSGPQTYLYHPATNTWTATGTKLRGDSSDEETWVKLPPTGLQTDGDILSFDVFNAGHAQKYRAQNPATGATSNTWIDAGTVPVTL